MNTCSDCKFWDKDGKSEAEMSAPSSSVGHRVCLHDKINSEYNNGMADGCLSYETITTGPNFGCIHFERK